MHKKGFAFKSSDYSKEGVYIVRVSDTTDHSVNISDCKRIPFNLAENHKDVELLHGDIVIMTVGSWPSNPKSVVGKVIKIPEVATGSLLNQNAVRLRATDKTTQDFLYYRLKSPDYSNYLISNAQGSANQASITLNDIYSFELKLPPLLEQKAIAEVLSSLDDKIDLLHRQNQTLESLAQTLFRHTFIDNAQDDWEEKTLDEILSVKGGTTPSTKNTSYWGGNIHWTTPRDLTGNPNMFLFDTARKITQEGLNQISSGLLPAGTLLLSSRAPVGYLAFSINPIAINQGYIAIIDDKEVTKNFIYLWIKENLDYIKSHSNGSTFQEISKSAFKQLSLIFPPKELRDEFEDQVEGLFKKILSNSQQIQTLSTLRDTLLPKLMNRKINLD